MLWCPGIPGAGKTILASISVDHLQTIFKDEDAAVLCLFCSYADQGHQKTIDLVASILEQLVQKRGVTDDIRALYQRHQTRATRPGLKELSELLQSVTKGFHKVFIVIDALDECPETARDTFVGELYRLRSKAHLLVTSRHSSSIAHEFHDAIHLEIHASDTDLEMYVRSKTQQDRRLAPHVKQDPSWQEDIIETIVGNARGMFLLVVLHLESLAKQKNKREMRKALRSLPKELNETYDQAMERIRSQDTESVRLAERVLAWISNARRPFSVEELQHALAVQPGEKNFDEETIYAEDFLVSVCAGLVTVDWESQVIRLVHHTTQEYFKRVRSEIFSTIQVEIAKVCITYLEFDDYDSDEYTHGEEHIKVSNELRLRYPFLDYAGRYWGHHARGAPEDVIGGMICRLLRCTLRLFLACDLIDDTLGMWNFGPTPALTLLVHFGLERIVSEANFCGEVSGLTCAIRYQHHTPVFFLVESGTDWHDNGEHTIRAECSSHRLEGNENMVRLLANKGVMVDLGVDNGEPLFQLALLECSDKNNLKPASTLLELGADFDPKSITYYTPLMRAVIGGDKLDVEWLLRAGADVNEKNEHGKDALIYAALARHEAVVRPLLEAGADVHARDEEGTTVLCAACKGGNKRIVKLLLENGADVSAQDMCGRTPIAIATECGHERLLQLLRTHGIDGHSKDEVESEAGGVLDEAQFNAAWDFFSRDHEPGSPGHKVIESVHRETVRMGYDKTITAFLDAYYEHKVNQGTSTNVEEQGTEPSKSDKAFLEAYFKEKASRADSTSSEEQESEPSESDDPAL